MNTKRKPRASRARANLRASEPGLQAYVVKLTFESPSTVDEDKTEHGEIVLKVRMPAADNLKQEDIANAVLPMLRALQKEGGLAGVDAVYADFINELPEENGLLWEQYRLGANNEPVAVVARAHGRSLSLSDPETDADIEPLLSLASS